MKKFLKVSGILLLCLFIAAVLFFKIEEISDYIIKFKAKLFAVNWKNTQVDFSNYDPIMDAEDAWYQNILVVHACGGIDGKTYTNSLDAFKLSLENGQKVIEADFALTADNQVVLQHDWTTEAPLYADFMKKKINYIYSPMDIHEVLSYMMDNKDLYIVTDIKGDRDYIGKLLDNVVKVAGQYGYDEVLSRFIIQIYYEKDYDYIKNIYPFENWIYTLYESADRDLNRIAEFCLINNIPVVTMPSGWVLEDDYIDVFNQMNIKVYVNTINDLGAMKEYRRKGVYGFYTDFIKPGDVSAVGL